MKNRMGETERLLAMTAYEREYWQNDLIVAGMDEVGRGPLAGPVVAACVILPKEPLIAYVNDSKKVSANRREKLSGEILSAALGVGLGEASPEEIDSLNILQATKLAFKRAYERVDRPCGAVLVDAVTNLDIPAKQRAIIKGDELSYLIAAASIVAKVYRDRLMAELGCTYPSYGFERNKGYGTEEHIEALRRLGATPIHRQSFIRHFVGERA